MVVHLTGVGGEYTLEDLFLRQCARRVRCLRECSSGGCETVIVYGCAPHPLRAYRSALTRQPSRLPGQLLIGRLRRRLPMARRYKSSYGRRKRCRPVSPAANILTRRRTATERPPAHASKRASTGCGDLSRGVRRLLQRVVHFVHPPGGDRAISPRIAIIASQKRSSSSFDSLSVGSIISVPAPARTSSARDIRSRSRLAISSTITRSA